MVVSTPLPQSTSSAARPVTMLSDDELHLKVGTTLSDTLKNEPGITSQSFGAGVGTPVIGGQSGPKVRVLQNSLGSNDVSSLSPDHVDGFYRDQGNTHIGGSAIDEEAAHSANPGLTYVK